MYKRQGRHRQVAQNLAVHFLLNSLELFAAEGLEVGEVEAQPLRSHIGACLVHVIAQNVLEGFMQQVGGGMVAGRLQPLIHGHHCLGGAGCGHIALFHHPQVADQPFHGFLHIGDAHHTRCGFDGTLISDLSAAFGVEGRAVQDQGHLVPLLGAVHAVAIHQDPHDFGVRG